MINAKDVLKKLEDNKPHDLLPYVGGGNTSSKYVRYASDRDPELSFYILDTLKTKGWKAWGKNSVYFHISMKGYPYEKGYAVAVVGRNWVISDESVRVGGPAPVISKGEGVEDLKKELSKLKLPFKK